MKRIFICLSLLLPTIAFAQYDISQSEALHKATAFFKKSNGVRKANAAVVSDEDYQLAYTAKDDGAACFYAFNRPNNQGFILVSADTRCTDEILAYSDTGNFDYTTLPDNAKYVIDAYAKGISEIKHTGKTYRQTSFSDIRKKAKGIANSVEPLLGDIEWGQDEPFNNLCPKIDGSRCLTGCVVTAKAQIMRYHRWPEKGRFSHSYEWNGQTLSADFSHTYNWDLMLPSYNNDYTSAQARTVAVLMRDLGYATEADYGVDATGASGLSAMKALSQYFDYDQSWGYMELEYTSPDHYKEVIYRELSESRPVASGSNNGTFGHEFVFDGFDSSGFVHINYGWNGRQNGYYSTTMMQFNKGQRLYYGIQKYFGGLPTAFTRGYEEFYIDTVTGYINTLYAIYSHDDFYYDYITAALAYENKETHEVKYQTLHVPTRPLIVQNIHVEVPEGLADGEYVLYPVYSMHGKEWERIYFPETFQDEVIMRINDGEPTYINEAIENADPGRVSIDGIYYSLDDESKIAKVTYKNAKRYNSYQGEVIIPKTVTYEGNTYDVKYIETDAFRNCRLYRVFIPSSVIGMSGFKNCTVQHIDFEPRTSDIAIAEGCFESTLSPEIVLPEGLTSLPAHAFKDHQIGNIHLPRSLTTVESKCFSFNAKTNVYAYWTEGIPTFSQYAFYYFLAPCMLYVPQGTKEKYAAIETWQVFYDIVEMEDAGIDTMTTNSTANVTKHLHNGRIVINNKEHQYSTSGEQIK